MTEGTVCDDRGWHSPVEFKPGHYVEWHTTELEVAGHCMTCGTEVYGSVDSDEFQWEDAAL